MQGSLFTNDFIKEGIRDTAQWKSIDLQTFSDFKNRVAAIFAEIPPTASMGEAATESDIIWPVLEALGWEDYLPQQNATVKGRRDVPDVLLFPSHEAKQAANLEQSDDRRYKHGIAIVESKKWQRPLDRGDAAEGLDKGAPSTQILRYLSRVEVLSDKQIQWGILTNGRHWRIYYQSAHSRSEEFFDLDLAELIGLKGLQRDLFSVAAEDLEHFLKVFYLMFRRVSFLPQAGDTQARSFHLIARNESKLWEEKVSQDLGKVVFDTIYPNLLQAIIDGDPLKRKEYPETYLEEVRSTSLTFLYRLLFLLYAEDRDLLSPRDTRYDDYSLREIRKSIADRIDGKDVFSEKGTRYHDHLKGLFLAIDEGDSSIGLPPYNGGLFDSDAHELLNRIRLSDAALAPIIDSLSRRQEGQKKLWINYRDLAVQHLGAVYERLLEYAVYVDGSGVVEIRPNKFARKGSGSYYTHDSLVQLILKRTVGPLVEEKVKDFHVAVNNLQDDSRALNERLSDLRKYDVAHNLMAMKICDPAMGSGHFLVGLVDYLSDHVLEQMAHAEEHVGWQSEDDPYHSPLLDHVQEIRDHIIERSKNEGWIVAPEHINDRQIIRRMILKRAIYGVDKNPMAVELAKVSLWLHTFTVGAPLSFLDHHLRCGDSLYGEWLGPVTKDVEKRGAFFVRDAMEKFNSAAVTMTKISRSTDADISEVKASKKSFDEVDETLRPIKSFMDFWHSLRWISPDGLKGSKKNPVHPGIALLLDGLVGDPVGVISSNGEAIAEGSKSTDVEAVKDLLAKARLIVERERFLHWELAFPTVWGEQKNAGGFDAIIGNPPWDRMKLQEVEWFGARRPEIGKATKAADRKEMVRDLANTGDELWFEYQEAREVAETSALVARKSGQYPLLSGGDVNIYSLFVERAQGLVKKNGIVGLLTPSGIASDKGASNFFRGVATGGRISALFDFENKKYFFPDIHASFKFCAFVFGGTERNFDHADCAFFLHRVGELDAPDKSFQMTAEDFASVNPNTGTAPIFRCSKDAAITKSVYERIPVLVDRRADPPRQTWPVKYHTMFHMTNDSNLFMRKDELESQGCYPVVGSSWKKGKEEYLPLYVGRMINRYDHRAAGVSVNDESLHNPALSNSVTLDEKANPSFVPTPQYWVERKNIHFPKDLEWAIAFRDIARSTDSRTAIACLIPPYAAGNTLPLILPSSNEAVEQYKANAPFILATMNSYVLDYLLRQKIQSTHLNWYIAEQLPFIPKEYFTSKIEGCSVGEFVREQVLRLTYVSNDMKPFAIDMGYSGDPFVWDAEDRRHRMARLDALMFHLYGIGKEDAAYILDTFPIIRKNDEKEFGRFLTKDLILAYMNAVAAGDFESTISL